MVSSTRQTKRRRHLRHKMMARNNRTKRLGNITPAFPIHPEGKPEAQTKPAAE